MVFLSPVTIMLHSRVQEGGEELHELGGELRVHERLLSHYLLLTEN